VPSNDEFQELVANPAVAKSIQGDKIRFIEVNDPKTWSPISLHTSPMKNVGSKSTLEVTEWTGASYTKSRIMTRREILAEASKPNTTGPRFDALSLGSAAVNSNSHDDGLPRQATSQSDLKAVGGFRVEAQPQAFVPDTRPTNSLESQVALERVKRAFDSLAKAPANGYKGSNSAISEVARALAAYASSPVESVGQTLGEAYGIAQLKLAARYISSLPADVRKNLGESNIEAWKMLAEDLAKHYGWESVEVGV
jgi:hypothetical protein